MLAFNKFVSCIAYIFRDKLAVILSTLKAFGILTDGSEARKTGLLIFVHAV